VSTAAPILAQRDGHVLTVTLNMPERRNYREGIQRLPLMFEALEVPVIAANPPFATRMTKRMLRKSWDAELETVLEIAAGAQALLHETVDHQEALDAFVEKRASVFRGE
jgi:enoyl-CoA hydratase/carnithine racemase